MQTDSEDRLLDYIDELESDKCNLVNDNDRMKREILHLQSKIDLLVFLYVVFFPIIFLIVFILIRL